MPEQALFQFPNFVAHPTETKPTARPTPVRRATTSRATRGDPKISLLSRRLSLGGKRAKSAPMLMLPSVPEVESQSKPNSAPRTKSYEGPRAAEFLPLKIDTCADMTPTKRASFLYMSNKHVEKDDYFRFDEEHQTATF
ncbi:hypothetical protein F4821DRAFT_254907 [Hypoxylon rubiginosum]|uniref:Uncharacterized protein n=1 Tax=Hypoxylon rubiginosum TaxID=110542 RepID=A0ACC0DFZ4_9PEZI|nr:hypothetical protein F4821DRAFT_254907 [Hypoxylon rubiginosum]